jgi:hypothetical protein
MNGSQLNQAETLVGVTLPEFWLRPVRASSMSGSRPRLEDLRPVRTTHSRAWSRPRLEDLRPVRTTHSRAWSRPRLEDVRPVRATHSRAWSRPRLEDVRLVRATHSRAWSPCCVRRGCFLKASPHIGRVGVGKVGALHHQEIDSRVARIDPGLRAIGTAVPEAAG